MFQGIFPAFVTPLNADGTLNPSATEKLLDFHLSQGADGFYIGGATGEGLVLAPDTRMELARTVCARVAGRKPVISHIAAIDLKTTLSLARQAEEAGCDCVAAIPPIYFAYDEDDVYRYYRAISDAVHIPVMIYYHPAAGRDMSAEFVKRLFEIENIRAVKWSKPDYFSMLRLKDITNGEMNIFNGPDETLLCGLACGADGGIGTAYNVMLPEVKAIFEAFRRGDNAQAQRMQCFVSRVISVMLQKPIIPVTKMLLTRMGFDVGFATEPMKRLSPEEEAHMLRALEAAGLRVKAREMEEGRSHL